MWRWRKLVHWIGGWVGISESRRNRRGQSRLLKTAHALVYESHDRGFPGARIRLEAGNPELTFTSYMSSVKETQMWLGCGAADTADNLYVRNSVRKVESTCTATTGCFRTIVLQRFPCIPSTS